jgi:N-methylhydantoinase B
MNSGRSGGLAAARVAFKSAVVPTLPPNEGVFRALRVTLPPGTIISATDNAAMAQWNMPLKTVIDTIYWAFSQCAPQRVPAAHHCSQGMYSFYGKDHETGRRFSSLDTALGGWGARPDADGFSPLKTVTHGDTRNVPVEVEEAFYPVLVERFEWRPDSAGPGRFRGGLGLHKVYRMLQEAQLVVAFERSKFPPWGLFGGGPAKVGYAAVCQPGRHSATKMFKVTALDLQKGAVVEFLSAGGGGRFPAWQRPVARVVDDVRQGYVTADGARQHYGVALDPVTLKVDEAATATLRAAMQAAR